MDEDEVLDLVDSNDQVIGTINRSDKSKGFDGYLRAAEIFLQNSKSQIWAPKRTLSKKIAPGGYDYSASGHVSSGEDYDQTILREVKEELNLDIDPDKLTFLHKFAPSELESMFFRAVYLYKTDTAPEYNTDDFTGYEWLLPKELLEKIRAGAPAKRSLPGTLEYLLENHLI